MARAMYRKAMWFRVATLCLALVFVIGFTGIGAAGPSSRRDSGEKIEAGDTAPPPDADADEKAPAPLDSDKRDGDPAEPVAADLDATAEPVVPEPPTVEPAVEPLEVQPAVEDMPIVPAVSITPGEEAELNVDFEGRHSDGSWTDGNLGSYDEGEWVSYRIIIKNKDSVDTYLPSFAVAYDYYRSQSDAIGLDKTKDWRFVPGEPVPGIVAWSPANAITPSTDPDAGMPGTIPGDTLAEHVVEFDDGAVAGLVVPGDGTVVIYFEAHLSITAWWQQQVPPHNGCSYYPGSSTHIALSGVGRQTLPWPVPPLPTGMVSGHKFLDMEPLGIYSDGADPLEIGLPDWDFTLADGTPGFPIALDATSDVNGDFQFGPLPAGDYVLTEAIAAPWATAYSFPMIVSIVAEGTTNVLVGNYPDVHPAIEVIKTASEPKIVTGSDVTYEYTITNTGDVPLHNIAAVDDKLDVTDVPIPDLDVGESYTFSKTTPLADTTTNVVDVTADDEYGNTVEATDDATVEVIDPSVSILKSVDQPHILVGGAVEYTYVVTNDGDAPLNSIEVTDDKLGPVGTAGSLAVGASTTITKTADIAVDTLNVATVTALDEFENPYTDSDEAEVTVHDPEISIVKSANPIVIIEGELVAYTYLVTNTGDMDLYDVTVTDDQIAGIIGYTPMLSVGSAQPFTAFENISVDTTNIGTVIGTYGIVGTTFGGQVMDTSSAFVNVVAPAIEVVKTASDSKIVTGSSVTYEYVVTNVGDVPLVGISAVDDKLDITSESIPDLAVGESYTFTKSTTLADTTTNVVEVVGFDEWEHRVTDSDDATVEVIDPSVSIVKTVDQPHILVGGAVEYTYVVTNDGDAPLMDIEVTDDQLGAIGTADSLAVGASTTFTKATNISVDTLNVATVTAMDEFENPYTDTDEAEVAVHAPGISIVKSADPTVIIAGELVEYSYLVTNTGDMDLFDVEVTDNLLGPIGFIAFLPVGMADTVSMTVPIDEDTVNIGTAIGHYEIPGTPFGGVVDDDSSAAVDVVRPAISVTKSASMHTVVTGSSVTYTYVVENVGDVLLVDIVAADDKLDISGTAIPDLAVGQSFEFSVATELTETTTNTVDVSGFDEAGHMVAASATETVKVVDPAVSIVKTAAPTVILAGETVEYTYLVTNEGDIGIHTVEVVDDKLGDIGESVFLDVGESTTFVVTSTLDVDTTNVATVTAGYGWFEGDMAVDYWDLIDSDDAFVDVVNPSISVVKSSDVPAGEGIEVGADTPVTYTYVVTNTGDVTLFDVVLTDDKLGDIADIGTLAVGESETIDVTAILNPQTADAITNVATVTAVDEYEHPVSDEDTHTVGTFDPFNPPDMALVKTANRTSADPGDIITYTLTWTNVGVGPSQGFTIVDDFDDTYLTIVDAGGGTVSGDTITWKFDRAAPGETGSVTYELQVADDMPLGLTNLDNVAVIIEPDDPNPNNDRDTWRVKVTVGEPFLPFTGGQLVLLLLVGFGLGLVGIMFRRFSILGRSA